MSEVVSPQPPTDGSPTGRSGNGLWGVMKAKGKLAGKRAGIAAQQTKIRAEMLLIDRKIQERKQRFGVELYDTLIVHAEQDPMFILDSDTLENIRGNFVTCFKDNKALLQKKALQQQGLVELDEQKTVAYPKTPAETVGEQMKNAGIAANFARKDAACKAKIAVCEADMQKNKRKFGVATYELLVQKEDVEKWLSPDRDVRFLYDAARRDIDQLLKDKQIKEAEVGALAQKM